MMRQSALFAALLVLFLSLVTVSASLRPNAPPKPEWSLRLIYQFLKHSAPTDGNQVPFELFYRDDIDSPSPDTDSEEASANLANCGVFRRSVVRNFFPNYYSENEEAPRVLDNARLGVGKVFSNGLAVENFDSKPTRPRDDTPRTKDELDKGWKMLEAAKSGKVVLGMGIDSFSQAIAKATEPMVFVFDIKDSAFGHTFVVELLPQAKNQIYVLQANMHGPITIATWLRHGRKQKWTSAEWTKAVKNFLRAANEAEAVPTNVGNEYSKEVKDMYIDLFGAAKVPSSATDGLVSFGWAPPPPRVTQKQTKLIWYGIAYNKAAFKQNAEKVLDDWTLRIIHGGYTPTQKPVKIKQLTDEWKGMGASQEIVDKQVNSFNKRHSKPMCSVTSKKRGLDGILKPRVHNQLVWNVNYKGTNHLVDFDDMTLVCKRDQH